MAIVGYEVAHGSWNLIDMNESNLNHLTHMNHLHVLSAPSLSITQTETFTQTQPQPLDRAQPRIPLTELNSNTLT